MSRAYQLSCLRATTIVVVVTRSIWNEIISAPFNLGALVELQKAHIRAHVHWIPNCIRTSSALLSPCLRCATPFSEWIVVRRRLNACIMMKPEQKANDRHKNLFFLGIKPNSIKFYSLFGASHPMDRHRASLSSSLDPIIGFKFQIFFMALLRWRTFRGALLPDASGDDIKALSA